MNLGMFVDGLVVVAGFVGWIVFVPQIRLLWRVKKSDTISLGMVWGSFALQTVLFIQGLMKENWPLVFVMSTSLICLCITLFLNLSLSTMVRRAVKKGVFRSGGENSLPLLQFFGSLRRDIAFFLTFFPNMC